MPLVPCRACGHSVDTSALACPRCGATDPAKKISRQQREVRTLLMQIVLGALFFAVAGSWLWREFSPVIKAAIVKPKEG